MSSSKTELYIKRTLLCCTYLNDKTPYTVIDHVTKKLHIISRSILAEINAVKSTGKHIKKIQWRELMLSLNDVSVSPWQNCPSIGRALIHVHEPSVMTSQASYE